MLPSKTIKGVGVNSLKFLRFALGVGDGGGRSGWRAGRNLLIAQGAHLGARG